MFYKYSSFGGRLTPSEANSAFQAQSLRSLKVTSVDTAAEMASSSGASIAQEVNKLSRFQRLFQTGEAPIHLRGGAKDIMTYRGAMVLSVVGIGVSLFTIFQMATGQMKKKSG
ncbi:predicted protein [Nematostella vectensis]|uniref:Uncharacterized protein n=1 Tax=Nematostella vectensis TaxID=45351 RepID=A7SL41_NEMVE|nr:uncharacterized protein LOC5506997 [Nematostella vectensis]EDO35591.1 predicted protein [Nematostella vectensis]|eukprot:XP_001627691.1 predicted protein [Nematostella vectensis]